MQRTQYRTTEPGRNSAGIWYRSQELHAMRNRGSEPRRAYYRCGRFCTVGHEWYVTVREGHEMGPYATRDEAELALACHVTSRFITSSGHIVGQLDAHGERDATTLEILVQELTSCREQSRLRSKNCSYAWAMDRLEKINGHPERFDYPGIRSHALKHFLSELDR